MIYIVESIAGIFAINDKETILDKVLFEKDPQIIAENIYHIQNGTVIEEYKTLLNQVNLENNESIIVEDKNIVLQLREIYPNITTQIPNLGGKYFRNQIIKILIEIGFIKNQNEFQNLMSKINLVLTRKKIGEASEKKDKFLCQAIETIDFIDKSVNVFSERIREWYGLHFPELNKLISNHLTYSRIASQLGDRENFSIENLMKINLPEDKSNQILNTAKESMGASLRDIDMLPIREFADLIRMIYEFREKLSIYLTDGMNAIAPNMSTVVGPLLAARLISLAGGLGEIAKKPSSTIQVLGAEQALFRSIKTGAKPPKHGIIYQWDDIHGSPWWVRGKISRLLAGKLSIASRVDAYSSNFMGDELLVALKARISEIKEKNPKPKKKPKKSKNGKIRKDKRKSRKRRNKKKR